MTVTNTTSQEGRRRLSWIRVLGYDDLNDLRGLEVTTIRCSAGSRVPAVRIVAIADGLTVVTIT